MSNNPFSDPYQPYQSPQSYSFQPQQQQPLLPGQKPKVWLWYLLYCCGMAMIYVLCAVLGVVFLALPAEMLEGEEAPEVIRIQGGVFFVLGIALFGLYAAAPFLPRTKFAWIYGFVTIGIGLTSCCTMPASIPLLIFWLKPDTKAYLNVR